MALFSKDRTIQSLALTQIDLGHIACDYCEKKREIFPESFSYSGGGSEPGGKQYHIVKSHRAAKRFIPKDEQQLNDFLEMNPDLKGTVSSISDTKRLLVKMSEAIFDAEFEKRNIAAEQRKAQIDLHAKEAAAKPALDKDGAVTVGKENAPVNGAPLLTPFVKIPRHAVPPDGGLTLLSEDSPLPTLPMEEIEKGKIPDLGSIDDIDPGLSGL